jgi:predicted ABC-type sugar transport system permease subunit
MTVVGRQIGLALIISVGITLIIPIGGIDLSVDSVVALVSFLVGEFIVSLGISPTVAVILALVGLINGSINAFMGIPRVVTVGMFACDPRPISGHHTRIHNQWFSVRIPAHWAGLLPRHSHPRSGR